MGEEKGEKRGGREEKGRWREGNKGREGREEKEEKEEKEESEEKGEKGEERREHSDVGARGTSSLPPSTGKPHGTDLVVAEAAVRGQPGHQRGDAVDAVEETFHHVPEAIIGARVQGRVKHQIRDHQIQLHLKQGSEPCLGVWQGTTEMSGSFSRDLEPPLTSYYKTPHGLQGQQEGVEADTLSLVVCTTHGDVGKPAVLWYPPKTVGNR